VWDLVFDAVAEADTTWTSIAWLAKVLGLGRELVEAVCAGWAELNIMRLNEGNTRVRMEPGTGQRR